MLKKIGLAAGAVALVGAPIALQASERVIAPVEGESKSKSLVVVQTV